MVDTGLYGALAGVAAITTALQAAVSLQSVADAYEIGSRNPALGTPEYGKMVRDAGQRRTVATLLNAPTTLVNVAVLASWWKVAVFSASPAEWELYVPWFAILAAALFLLAVAVIGMVRLHRLANR